MEYQLLWFIQCQMHPCRRKMGYALSLNGRKFYPFISDINLKMNVIILLGFEHIYFEGFSQAL